MARTKGKLSPILTASTKGMKPQELEDLFSDLTQKVLQGAAFIILQVEGKPPKMSASNNSFAALLLKEESGQKTMERKKESKFDDIEWKRLKERRMKERYQSTSRAPSTKEVQDGTKAMPSDQTLKPSEDWEPLTLHLKGKDEAKTPKGWLRLKLCLWEK